MREVPEPKKLVLVCCNDREGECCSKVNGLEILQELKSLSKENNLPVRVTKSGCLGQCNALGCTIAFEPEHVVMREVTKADLPAIKKRMLK